MQKNCDLLALQSRAELILKNVNDISPNDLGMFDIIVSNPPYISKDDIEIQEMVKKFEPGDALFAESNGFELLKSWSSQFAKNLNSTGLMAFEMGYLQGPTMAAHFAKLELFSKTHVVKDLSGLDRIIKGIR